MLKWAIVFALIAAVAALLGFSGLAGALAGIDKMFFYAALIILLLLLLLSFVVYWKVGRPLLHRIKR